MAPCLGVHVCQVEEREDGRANEVWIHLASPERSVQRGTPTTAASYMLPVSHFSLLPTVQASTWSVLAGYVIDLPATMLETGLQPGSIASELLGYGDDPNGRRAAPVVVRSALSLPYPVVDASARDAVVHELDCGPANITVRGGATNDQQLARARFCKGKSRDDFATIKVLHPSPPEPR